MSRQILPFPLPTYLATYFGNKLSSEKERLSTGSYEDPFEVSSYSEYGNFILKNLKPSTKPYAYNHSDKLFLSFPERVGQNKKNVIRLDRDFCYLDEAALLTIEQKFYEVFRSHLSLFVLGAERAAKNDTARIRTKAIMDFCEFNNVIYTDKNLVAWKKMCQRNKKRGKPLIYGVL